MKLSVIVPTRNRSQLLAAFLDSLQGQTLPASDYEVLVVDNGSTDDTRDVVAGYATRTGNLRYVYEPAPGLHEGRHRGLIEAANDVLVYADDDIEAFPTWLSAVREAFADPGVAMAGGNNVPMFMVEPPRWLTGLWERPARIGGRALPALSILQLDGGARPFDPQWVWGCNLSVRKSVVLGAGGFHPDGMPSELKHLRGDGENHIARHVQQLGLTCVFHPGASVHHKVTPERMTIDYFRARGFGQGISDSYTVLREGGSRAGAAPPVGIVSRALGWATRRLRDAYELDGEARRALAAERDGYRQGFAFHQRAYREDDELRAWVHRPSYLPSGVA